MPSRSRRHRVKPRYHPYYETAAAAPAEHASPVLYSSADFQFTLPYIAAAATTSASTIDLSRDGSAVASFAASSHRSNALLSTSPYIHTSDIHKKGSIERKKVCPFLVRIFVVKEHKHVNQAEVQSSHSSQQESTERREFEPSDDTKEDHIESSKQVQTENDTDSQKQSYLNTSSSLSFSTERFSTYNLSSFLENYPTIKSDLSSHSSNPSPTSSSLSSSLSSSSFPSQLYHPSHFLLYTWKDCALSEIIRLVKKHHLPRHGAAAAAAAAAISSTAVQTPAAEATPPIYYKFTVYQLAHDKNGKTHQVKLGHVESALRHRQESASSSSSSSSSAFHATLKELKFDIGHDLLIHMEEDDTVIVTAATATSTPTPAAVAAAAEKDDLVDNQPSVTHVEDETSPSQ